MWYIRLLEELATSPKSPFKQETVFFIKELLNEIQLGLLDGEDFEIEFIMGFFSDVFYCVERYKKHHMPLAQFARICMGLAILHIKKSEDAVDFCCSDFLGVLNNEKIYEIMDLDHKISSFVLMSYTNFKEGKLIYKPMGSLTARDVDENLLYRNQLIYLILTDMLKKLEFKSFASLNYNVTVDFDRFLAILN